MRKTIIIIIYVTIIFTFNSNAMNFGLNIKQGLNISTILTDWQYIDEDKKMYLGSISGIGFSFGIVDFFTIQPEILFSMKGIRFNIDDFTVEFDQIFALNYLEFPVLFKFNIPSSKLIPNFYIGPGFDVLLSAKEKIVSAEGNDEGDIFENIKEDVNNYDFILVSGGGLELLIKKIRILLDIRYSIGLINIEINNISSFTNFEKSFLNSSISTFIGLAFYF